MEHAINSDDQTDFSNGRAQMAVDLDLVAKREPSTAGRVDLRVAAQGNGKFKPPRSRRKNAEPDEDASKRRCISTACVACRKRKSKCDGNTPACAACSQVYGTDCVYDPNSDHRRKGVYKSGAGSLKTREVTLQTIMEALLTGEEENAYRLVREMRSCDNLDALAESIVAQENGIDSDGAADASLSSDRIDVASGVGKPTFETQLCGRVGELRLDDGSVRYIGGTSNLIHVTQDHSGDEVDQYEQQDDPITSWTRVTDDAELVVHLLNMYFTWHYSFFTVTSKSLFWRDFLLGQPPPNTRRKTHYCTPLLVNAMLALGCHFTSYRGAREEPDDSATAGDHFFREAKRLIMENDEHEKPRLTTVQALALMSVREAGCAREAKGWIYSGMAFRMACDMGLNLDGGPLASPHHGPGEEDVRLVTFWGCFLFDKCWSNYLGRLPQLPTSNTTTPKYDVFPDEDAAIWRPYKDSGFATAHAQPARTRAVALQISHLCEISNDLMQYFYNPTDLEKHRGKQAELKMLSDIQRRLETWRADLPPEMQPREGSLSSVLTMHMFFQLLYIHLFRPFLRYTQRTSPLPPSVSPRKQCTHAASMIMKLMRLYKRSYGLRQICNICVYIAHSACSIHLLSLPDKVARSDIVHGVKHLEEIAESWLCARRSLGILSVLAHKWKVDLPDEARAVLTRVDRKFGPYDVQSRPAQQRPDPADAVLAPHNPVVAPLPQQHHHYHVDSPFTPHAPAPSFAPHHHPPSYLHSGPPPATYAQALQQSHDWTYEDQAQFGRGFENWTGVDLGASAMWSAPDVVDVVGMHVGAAAAAAAARSSAAPGQGYAMMELLNGIQASNNVVEYNEEYR